VVDGESGAFRISVKGVGDPVQGCNVSRFGMWILRSEECGRDKDVCVGDGVVGRCEEELITGRDAKCPQLVQCLGEQGQFGLGYVG
jgi:hypothetical protein